MIALPTDIILMVVDTIDEFKDRRKLLQVCRSWRSLLLPKVYSKVTLDIDESLVPLAHTVLLNRSIGATVRELRIPNLFCKAGKNGIYHPELFREIVKPFTVTPEDLTEWEDSLDAGDEEAWLVVVLLSLNNLRYLGMRHHSYSWDFTFRTVAQLASNSVCVRGYAPLSHLEEVNIMSETVYQNFPAARFAPFFRLPSMRVFRAAGVHEEHEGRRASFPFSLNLEPKSSQVREIILDHSNCRRGMIEYVSSCANLEYFEYQHSNAANHGDVWLDFRPRRFHIALSTQKHSLRVLRLNDRGSTKGVDDLGMEDEGIYSGDDVEIEPWFGSLVDFTELRELRIPVRNLLQSDYRHRGSSLEEILPRSLEYLSLAKTDQAEFDIVEPQLCSLLALRSKCFPALRKLVIQLYQMELIPGKELRSANNEGNCRVPHSTKEVFEEVRKTCGTEGVKFSFAHDGEYQVLADGKLVWDNEMI
ncbi:predicted protein [Aspergillus terreus NIH2624]|uniref:Leucine-rich repeat domain-containing protein n=1 Tax=Aspergillus terreus (strain NIH 2624 / FGSC A1156) TaxID=341663 RepID=Q0CUD6_ASPTN|nr:uncharacterized protein ATEG_02698 [Aspergillus terreus NIH2624]EAU37660.1 predicted protein [Aspergillus terreus NIH2624]